MSLDDHKNHFDALKATRDSLVVLLESAQDSLATVEGQMDEATLAWANDTGRPAEELIPA